MERHHLGVTRNALRENRLVIFGLCSIGLRRHGPFISCHIFLPLCFALSGTHLGSSFLKTHSFLDIRNMIKLWLKHDNYILSIDKFSVRNVLNSNRNPSRLVP